MDSYDILNRILPKLDGVKARRQNEYDFHCPLQHKKKAAAARIWIDPQGILGVCCFDCGRNKELYETIIKANTPASYIKENRYTYEHPDGTPRVSTRQDGAIGKKFFQPNGQVNKGTLVRILTPETPIDDVVIWVEGERCASAVREAGFYGASSIAGATSAHLTDYAPFKSRRILIWGDDDEAGRKAVIVVSRASYEAGAASVQVAPAQSLDAADLPLEERTKRIQDLIASSPNYQPDIAKQAIAHDDEGLAFALGKLGIEYRYNKRAGVPEIDRGKGWERINDRNEAALMCKIAKSFIGRNGQPAKFGRDTWRDSFNALLDAREIDPFKVWLDALPEWDSVERLNCWLGDCFGILPEDVPLMQWASQAILLGAIWRTHKPTKLDDIVVLIGAQGIAKSTAIAHLFPADKRGEWFSDGLVLSDDDKTKIEALQGSVIVECSELSGMRRALLENLKGFITRIQDDKRMAYARYSEPMPRMCVIVGTTNSDTPLPNDPTGNRRFVPIKVEGDPTTTPYEVRKYLDANRVQLWSEALAAYKRGVQAWLHPVLLPEQKAAADRARNKDDVLEDKVFNWTKKQNGVAFTIVELARGIGYLTREQQAVELDSRQQFHIGNALRQMGYDKKQRSVDGRRVMQWSKIGAK